MLADWIAQNEINGRLNKFQLTLSTIGIFFIISILFLIFLFYYRYPKLPDTKKLAFLTHIINKNDVVLSDIFTNEMVPTYGGKVIAIANAQAFVNDQENRRTALQEIFSNKISKYELMRIMKYYNVKYILINKNKQEYKDTYKLFLKSGRIKFDDDNFSLIEVFID